jgi:hypothetical protein
MAWLLRRLHGLHRALGSVLCLLMASWFLSGAVMTFAGYPRYSERARLRDLLPLGAPSSLELSAELRARLSAFMSEPSAELSLTRVLSAPRLLLSRGGERAHVLELSLPHEAAPISAAQARSIAERVVGARARTIERLEDSDQWSVALPRSLLPLWHVSLDDAERSELYLSAASAQIVQRTTRQDRILAWLGAIPHWIYPTVLRRQRGLWQNVVIGLACFGIVLSATGLIAGLDTARRRRRRRARGGLAIHDRSLRWHQRIGLAFGALALSWLVSGILSFNPFDWTATRGLSMRAEQRLRGGPSVARAGSDRLLEALALCQRALSVHELRLRYVAGVPVASCIAADGALRVIALDGDTLALEERLSPVHLQAAVRAVVGADTRFGAQRVDRADQYYYPTHTASDLVLPAVRVDAEDEPRSRYYLDPRTGELLYMLTERTRLARYLFNGLHSWDFAFLYAQRGLWRTCLLFAMALGASLSLLGAALALRRVRRRRRQRRRLRARQSLAQAALDTSGQSVG